MPFNYITCWWKPYRVYTPPIPGDNNIFLVALTELEADDTIVDITKVETHVANAYN